MPPIGTCRQLSRNVTPVSVKAPVQSDRLLLRVATRLRGIAAAARRRLLPDGTRGQRRYHALRAALTTWWHGPHIAPAPTARALEALVGSELSVVVMALDAQPELVEAVRSLDQQFPRPEIIVVNSGATGAHARLTEAGLDVTVVESSTRLYPGAARNVGIAAAHGRYVAFLAADCIARPGWVACRIESHRSGADMVSSPVVNGYPWNPFAVAAHILLFATRLPGTPSRQRRHYGASYDITLFRRYGFFSSELRAGEDTELNARLKSGVKAYYDARVQTAHRNPRMPWSLLRDQYQRGRRRAVTSGSIGTPATPLKFPNMGFRRANTLARIALNGTPGSSWAELMLAFPWIYPASLAYLFGFWRGLHTLAPTSVDPSSSARRKRLVALLQFHNDHAFLPGYLQNVASHVDGILILDDGSHPPLPKALPDVPKVLEVLTLPPRSPHHWDERRNQRLLLDAARRHGADWLLALDTDERIEHDFRRRANPYMDTGDRQGVVAYNLILRELWGSANNFRVDGIWGRKRRPRMFKTRDDHGQGSTELHGIWAPLDAQGRRCGYVAADLIIYHLAMITSEQRRGRQLKYKRLDPENLSQSRGYEYLTDESGLLLSSAPEERGFNRLHIPPEISDGDSATMPQLL